MGKIAKRLTDLVSSTPLLELSDYNASKGLGTCVVAKLEYFNPAGSVRDRISLIMAKDVEVKGTLRSGSVIIELTSGNAGVGLTFVAAAKEYRLILVIPDTISMERGNLLKALGAELVLTPGANRMKRAIAKAEELQTATPGSVILQQFENPTNPVVHVHTTGREIWRDIDGKVDIFVVGVETGGTVSEVGAALKEHNPTVRIVAVGPAGSPVLSGGAPDPHKIQGIGAGSISRAYNAAVVDEIKQIGNDDAIRIGHKLAAKKELLVGIPSGAVVYATTGLTRLPENEGKLIVVLLPDIDERYLSTVLYTFEEYPL